MAPFKARLTLGGKGLQQVRDIFAAVQKPLAQPSLLPGKGDLHGLWGGGEMPGLVELGVIGDIGFGRKPQQTPLVEHGGTVVQRPLPRHRDTHRAEDVQPGGIFQQGSKGAFSPGKEGAVLKQIPAGVGGEGQLWETHSAAALAGGLLDLFQNLGLVFLHIGHSHRRRCGGDAIKSVFHSIQSFPME